MARVPYVDSEDLPEEYDILEEEADRLHDSIDAEYWRTAKTVRAFGNNPELAEPHVHTNVALWTKTGLSPREVEIVILAVARALEAPFVWHAHVLAAVFREEMDPETVLAISQQEFETLDETTRRLAAYAFEFVTETGGVSDATHDALASVYDDDTIVGVAMLAGFYVHLHHVGSALGIEHGEDETFVGWGLENLPSGHERYR